MSKRNIKLSRLQYLKFKLYYLLNVLNSPKKIYVSDKEFCANMQDLLTYKANEHFDYDDVTSNVNYIVLHRLLAKIRKHPVIWCLFFMYK